MTTGYRELHDELRGTARDLLATQTPEWSLLADVGWLGLEAPEACGGAGAGFAEVAVILDEIGRAAAPIGYLGAVVLAVGVLNEIAPDPQRDALLGRVVTGESRVAVALPTDGSESPVFHLRGPVVSGRAEFVPDAAAADEILLLAADAGGEPVIAAVGRADVELTPQPVLDETRHFATVSAPEITARQVWRFTDPQRGARRLTDRARLAVACDSLGLAEAMLGATVDYARVRHQFSRPIGSFQAVKHACADMLVAISAGRRLVRSAVDAVAEDAPESETAVLMAKAFVCAHAPAIVGKAMQLHGGIGYTWEHGIHRYLKRAALNRSLFGSPAAHRRQLALRYRE